MPPEIGQPSMPHWEILAVWNLGPKRPQVRRRGLCWRAGDTTAPIRLSDSGCGMWAQGGAEKQMPQRQVPASIALQPRCPQREFLFQRTWGWDCGDLGLCIELASHFQSPWNHQPVTGTEWGTWGWRVETSRPYLFQIREGCGYPSPPPHRSVAYTIHTLCPVVGKKQKKSHILLITLLSNTADFMCAIFKAILEDNQKTKSGKIKL